MAAQFQLGSGDNTQYNTGDLTRPGHQGGVDTGTVNPLYIEEYGGEVDSQIIKTSIMRGFIKVQSVRGTDTITNDQVGTTSLQAVAPGVRPTPGVAQFDNVSVKVDTVILARNNVAMLDDFQNKYNVRAELGKDHGKIIGRFYDEAHLIQGMKAARITGAGLLPGFQPGTVVTLDAAGDEVDPDKLQRAIEDMCQEIEEKDMDLDGFALFMPPAQYYALLRNDKLVDGDFSMGNGDYAKAKVMNSCGVAIFKTNRLPTEAVTDHYLSNAGNSAAYDVTAAEAKIRVLALHRDALLAGETIPLTSKVYWSDIEIQWFIDSYLAFGATPNRGEYAALIEIA